MEKETGRLEAFSDGVFAFAITLLVLDLHVPALAPQAGSGELARALAEQWPSYLAFLVSFATVLIMWLNHHAIFKQVHRISRHLIFANGVLLLLVVTTPFTTALLARYLMTPAGSIAAAVYAGSFVWINLSYQWLFRAASECGKDGKARRVHRSHYFGLTLYLLATATAFVSPVFSLLICMGLWVLWASYMEVGVKA